MFKKIYINFTSSRDFHVLIILSIAVTLTLSLFVAIWVSIFRSSACDLAIANSEWRIILATSAAALISLGSTLMAWRNQLREIKLDIAKKSIELNTETAFDMWKSCTAAYRLLAKADTEEFEENDKKEIAENFEHSERLTLLVNDETLGKFKFFWQESERIAFEFISASNSEKTQSEIWGEEISDYADRLNEMKSLLRGAINNHNL